MAFHRDTNGDCKLYTSNQTGAGSTSSGYCFTSTVEEHGTRISTLTNGLFTDDLNEESALRQGDNAIDGDSITYALSASDPDPTKTSNLWADFGSCVKVRQVMITAHDDSLYNAEIWLTNSDYTILPL